LNSEFRRRTPELFQQKIQTVERAMSIDENDTGCHRIMCRIALIQGQFAKREHHLECALALNPNDPRLVVQRGINLTFLGGHVEAECLGGLEVGHQLELDWGLDGKLVRLRTFEDAI
jgi:hypothetical protein